MILKLKMHFTQHLNIRYSNFEKENGSIINEVFMIIGFELSLRECNYTFCISKFLLQHRLLTPKQYFELSVCC